MMAAKGNKSTKFDDEEMFVDKKMFDSKEVFGGGLPATPVFESSPTKKSTFAVRISKQCVAASPDHGFSFLCQPLFMHLMMMKKTMMIGMNDE